MKEALITCTVGSFLNFELNDIAILQGMGYKVHVAANFRGYDDMKKKINEMNVEIHQVEFSRSPFSKQVVIAYRQLRKLMQEEHFDLVHCHTPVGGGLSRLTAKKYRKKGTKVIYTAHGFHFFQGAPLKNWMIYYPIEKILSCWTDILITINKEDYTLAQREMKAKKIFYIPGVGLDTKKFRNCKVNKKEKREELRIPNDAFVLLSVGELHSRKNQSIIIEALHKIKNENVYYVCVGNGELWEEYKELIEKYGLEEKIKMLGCRQDIGELCKMADCFVHPSVREGLGIAPLEAMASGLPLISANVNGMKDYTSDGVSGCCVSPKSCDEMKAAILKMYWDIDFRKQCGKNNSIIARRFDISNTEKIMKEIYMHKKGFVKI